MRIGAPTRKAQHLSRLKMNPIYTEAAPLPVVNAMRDSGIHRCGSVALVWVTFLVLLTIIPLAAQSNHTTMLLQSGSWHLRSRIPLGSDGFLLQPSHQKVRLLATAEAQDFEGWRLTERQNRAVLVDASGKAVKTLPKSITFRVTAGALNKLEDADPLPLECTKSVNDFLLDLHFSVQIFRGMEMRRVEPVKTWMIGVPAEEESDERVYRSSFQFEDLRPDDRIVLLITDGSGARLSKFHLEFL